jgi:DNA-binding LacI/PurR family transcriptional regulator
MTENSTLREVAKRAGVSVSTASQALANKPNVASETRARVVEAAVALGYQQKVRIASPITHRLSIIGLLTRSTPDLPIPVNPFYSYVLAGAERECQRMNLSLMYANIEVDQYNNFVSRPPMLFDTRVDGVLIVGSMLSEMYDEMGDKPIVLVDSYAPHQAFDSVVTDNVNGAFNAVSYLIQQGHRHIGLVGSMPDGYPSIRERRKGYMRALKRHGISDVYTEDSPLIREAVYDATKRLLSRAPQVTAIFACNDNVAVGALHAAQDCGRDVPNELSLIGFDDIDLSREIKPALTTVYVDKLLMGSMAVRLMRDRAEDPYRTTVTALLSTRLMIRDSVKPLKEVMPGE